MVKAAMMERRQNHPVHQNTQGPRLRVPLEAPSIMANACHRVAKACHLMAKALVAFSALLACGTLPLHAQLPYHRLERATPNSAQIASTNTSVTIKITGAELQVADRLITDIPGASSSKVDDSTYRLALPANPRPGLYDLRLAGRYGISAPRRFALDPRPHTKQQEPKLDGDGKVTEPPHALNSVILGEARASNYANIAFSAKAGTPITADCYATRIDSRLHAELSLYGPDGKRITSTRNDVGDDPVLTATASADGIHQLKLRDVAYAGGANHFYRVVLHTGPHVTHTTPAAIAPGETATVTLHGHNLPAPTLELSAPKTELNQNTSIDFGTLLNPHQPRQAIAGFSHWLPQASSPIRIGFAQAPNRVDALPLETSGVFSNEASLFEFDASKGSTFMIELFSHRLGSAADPAFILQRINKKADTGELSYTDLTNQDDAAPITGDRKPIRFKHRDPAHLWKVDQDGRYRLRVFDQFATGAPFRLVIREPRPDFELILLHKPPHEDAKKPQPKHPILFRNGSARFEVQVGRSDGHKAPIQLKVEGLPEGVTADVKDIPSGGKSAQILLHAATNASAAAASIRVVGISSNAAGPLTRHAIVPTLLWPVGNTDTEYHLPRLTSQLPVAVFTTAPVPVSAQPKGDAKLTAKIGDTFELPLDIRCAEKIKGELKIRPVNFPGLKKVPELKLKDKPTAGTLKFNFAKDQGSFKPGPATFVLSLDGNQQNFRANPAAVTEATAAKTRAAAAVAPAEAAFKTADAAQKAAKPKADQAAAALNNAKSEHAAVMKLVNQATQMKAKAEKEHKDITDQLATLSTKRPTAIPPDAEPLRTEHSALFKKLPDFEPERKRIAELNAQLKQAEGKQLADIETGLKKARAALEQKEAAHKKLSKRIAELEQQLAAMTQGKEAIAKKRKALEQSLPARDKALAQATAQADEAEKKRAAAQTKLDAAGKAEAETKAAHTAAQTAFGKAKAELDRTKAELKTAEAVLKTANDKNKPRDFRFLEYSRPITIMLTE